MSGVPAHPGLDQPVAAPGPDHAEPGRDVGAGRAPADRAGAQRDRPGALLAGRPGPGPGVEPPGGEHGQLRYRDPGHVEMPERVGHVRALRAVDVDRAAEAQHRGAPQDRGPAGRRGVGRQPDQGRPVRRAVPGSVASRAELAGVEAGDHGAERDEREGTRRVAVVELDDRPAGAQAILVPVPVMGTGQPGRVADDRRRVTGAARAGAGSAAGHGDERAAWPGAGLHHHRVVREPADVREAGGGPGRADEGVGEEPGELRGVQPDSRDPVAAGPVGAAGSIRVGGPLGVQCGGIRRLR